MWDTIEKDVREECEDVFLQSTHNWKAILEGGAQVSRLNSGHASAISIMEYLMAYEGPTKDKLLPPQRSKINLGNNESLDVASLTEYGQPTFVDTVLVVQNRISSLTKTE